MSLADRRRGAAVLVAALLLAAVDLVRADPLPHAIGLLEGDGTLGSHLSDRTFKGVSYDQDLPPDWLGPLPWDLGSYVEFEVARWHACTGRDCGGLTDFGVSPVFRSWTLLAADHDWFLEASLGAHLISQTRIAAQVYSTAFQFGEFAGIGRRFGDDGRVELGLRYQHESNSVWKTPNDGMNFIVLRLAVRW